VAGSIDTADLDQLPPGLLQFEFVTLDGRRSHSEIEIKFGDSGAARLTQLSKSVPWTARPGQGHADPPKDIKVALWACRKSADGSTFYERVPVDQWQREVNVVDGRLALDLVPGTYAVQMVGRGVSVMTRLPSAPGNVVLDAQWHKQERKTPSFAPLPLVGKDLDWTWIYGSFLASGAAEAARALGRKLQDQMAKEPVSVRAWRIALGQWAMRIGPRQAKIGEIRRLLRDGEPDTDALVLDWLLCYDNPSTEQEMPETSFGDVIQRVCDSPPVFTETLALMAERFEPAFDTYLAEKPDGDAQAQCRHRFHKLLSATLWDLPLLTYRAARPDLSENDADLETGTATKKKSDLMAWAVFRFD
jgi:hypothetical protein